MAEPIETQFARLDERLKALDAKGDEHHNTILSKIEEIQSNYAARLLKVEDSIVNADKVYAAKAEEDKRDAKADLRITKLENWQNKIVGGLILLNIILGILIYFIKK